MIAEDKVAELRQRSDLVEIVGEFVRLRRVGSSLRGLCPFHSEKTPSFYVHPDRQFFHCFGCSASGDVFTFLMRLEGQSFPEVLQRLAERAGIPLEQASAPAGAGSERRRQRDRQFALLELAASFFCEALKHHPRSQAARDMLAQRQVSIENAEAFRLGYAPPDWDALLLFLRKEGFSLEEAAELGLLVPKRSHDGFYDRFRHRLIFPIRDAQGRVLAFSARRLADEGEAASEPKYINSPEHALFRKGECLFGIFEARVALRRSARAVLCEGNFDVVSLHAAGVSEALAPLGTAFTEAQATLLRRYCSEVYLLFDGDAAGKKAVVQAGQTLLDKGFDCRVVSMPQGADPDSFVRERGPEALQRRLEEAPPLLAYLIEEGARWAKGDPRRSAESISRLAPMLKASANPVEIQLWIERIGRSFGIQNLDIVRRQLRQGLRGEKASAVPAKKAQAAPAPKHEALRDEARLLREGPLRLEYELVGAILDNPELLASEEGKELEELLTSYDLQSIFYAAARMMTSSSMIDASTLVQELRAASNAEDATRDASLSPSAEETGPQNALPSANKALSPASLNWLAGRLTLSRYDRDTARQALRDGLPRLRQRRLEAQLRELQAQIVEARQQGDETRAAELTRQHTALFRSMVGSESHRSPA